MITADRAKPDRILVVALDNLGDLVFASALTPPLHEAFPGATIDVWSKSYTADVARLIPHVSSVIHADPFWGAGRGVSRAPAGRRLRRQPGSSCSLARCGSERLGDLRTLEVQVPCGKISQPVTTLPLSCGGTAPGSVRTG